MRLRVAAKVYKAWSYRHRKGTLLRAIAKLTADRRWARGHQAPGAWQR